MKKLNDHSDWLYGGSVPVRWLRAAAAAVDEQLAMLCAHHCQRPQLARVVARRLPHPHRCRR